MLDSACPRTRVRPRPLPDGATPQASVVRHYTDASDNPGWVETGGVVTKCAPSLAGDLGIQMSTGTGGKHELSLANPHGDIVTTVAIPATGSVSGITAWADYTEYGAQRDPAATRTISGPLGYGWLGAKERASASETYGLTLMGARYYNPTTGRFTSHDPIYGGNPNTYTYPVDPINMTDLTGLWWGWKKTLRRAAKVSGVVAAGACIVATAGACGVAVGAAFVASTAWNGYQYRQGSISGTKFFRNVAVDFGLTRFRALRGLKYPKGASIRSIYRSHKSISGSWKRTGRLALGYVRHATRSIRGHYRVRPWRSRGIIAINGYGAYRAWRN